jgi:hypothetical protein
MNYFLFRLDAAHASDPLALGQGLRRHLAVAPLLSVLVRIGQREQAYVALEGCGGCAIDRCEPGCRVELLRRTVRSACGASGGLHRAPKGLAARPYARVVLARPRNGAQMLGGELLRAFDDARLTLHWHMAPKGPPRLGAALAVGTGGPHPAVALRECGWRAWPVPPALLPLARKLFCSALPRGLPVAGQWPGEPSLLLAASAHHLEERVQRTKRALSGTFDSWSLRGDTPSELAGQDSDEDADRAALRRAAYLHLSDILDGRAPLGAAVAVQDAQAAPDCPGDEESTWPRGPGEGRAAMSPAHVEGFVLAALVSDDITRGAEPGLTRKRVAALLAERHKEHAATLVLWLEAAGLLELPLDEHQPYRRPRPLACVDAATIAERLRSAPLPTAAKLASEKAKGL